MKKAIVHTLIGKFEVKYSRFDDTTEGLIVFYLKDNPIMSFKYTDIVIEWK